MTTIGKDHPLARLTGDGAGENPAKTAHVACRRKRSAAGSLPTARRETPRRFGRGATQGRSLADRAHMLRLVATELKMLCRLLRTFVIAAMAGPSVARSPRLLRLDAGRRGMDGREGRGRVLDGRASMTGLRIVVMAIVLALSLEPALAGGHGSYSYSLPRDSHGRIERSAKARDEFKKSHPCPSTGRSSGACPGYVIDHVVPLKRGGGDQPSNMQWQTIPDAKAKDKWQ